MDINHFQPRQLEVYGDDDDENGANGKIPCNLQEKLLDKPLDCLVFFLRFNQVSSSLVQPVMACTRPTAGHLDLMGLNCTHIVLHRKTHIEFEV